MKKATLISFIILFAVTLVMPALAAEDAEVKKIKDVSSDTLFDKTLKKMPRARILWGELVEIKGATLPTELVVKLSKVRPKRFTSVVETPDGTASAVVWGEDRLVTVKVDDKTRFVRRYWGKSSLSELTIGDKLHIAGRLLDDGTFRAWLVKDDSIHVTFRVHNGVIQTLDVPKMTLTMKEDKNIYTVKADASTKISIPGMASSTFADLKIGNKIHVRGVINNKTKVIAANLIRVGFPLKVVSKLKPAATSTLATATTTVSTTTNSNTSASTASSTAS